jgi:hypothetical protein
MRRPKPYYKKSHAAWHVDINKKLIRLASQEEGEAATYHKYDKIMAGKQPINDDCKVAGRTLHFARWRALCYQ